MTELRCNAAGQPLESTPRLHKQHSLRDSLPLTNGHGHGHAHMLHSLQDAGNLSSAGSTSSSTATTTATALAARSNCNGGGSGNLEFDEHDIYYVSPSKRKGVGSSVGIAPSYPSLRPANAYGEAGYDLDATMQMLRSATNGSNATHNVVTFSNYVSEQRAPSTRASTPTSMPQYNRGSLKRSKGRSNQSLCSCDAGDEADLKLDPTRPLYEYSLERRRKTHTYTCEQNAQILMRLERERNRKLSLTSMAGIEQNDTSSLLDLDVIPPVPPPPAMKRNGSMRSLRLLQQLQQNSNNNSSSSSNHAAGVTQLCSSDLLQDCTKTALHLGGTALDDCAGTLLKCAANGQENNNPVKPDVCPSTMLKYYPPHITQDDICTPHSKKSDPSLCFLHSAGTAAAASLSKSQRDLQQAAIVTAASAASTLSKYNTIGPSSDYARHLAHYSRYLQKQHQQQQLAHFQQQRCRCFSQSLASFPREYFVTRSGSDNQQPQLASTRSSNNNIFHTSSDAQDWFNGNNGVGVGVVGMSGTATLPINSRSFGNLVDMEARNTLGNSCRAVAYQKFQPGNGNANGNVPGTGASSTFTMTSFDSADSGLKDKYQAQQQLQTQLQPPHHYHEHHVHGAHPLLQHATHAVGMGVGVAGAGGTATPQKHHQLHSSVTSIMPWKHRQCPSRGSSSSGTNSFRFDAAKHWLAVSSILLIIGAASVAVPLALRVAASAPFEERLRVAVQLLDQVPLIDGHNDLPWNIRKFLHNKLNDFNFDEDLRNVKPWDRSLWSHTDLTRLKKGRISAQFWAAYVPCEAQHRDAVQLTLEQIDVIKRLTDRYAPQLTTCTSAEDIRVAHKNHQLCSLTGVEGGHSLGGSLAVLRTLYAIGVRYMTLTSTCHTPWADSSYADAPTFNMKHGGLTLFGKTIIREMNRLGMMVDLSHVSKGTMRDALNVSAAPVIFSHSSAYELCNTSRNVQDDILQALAKNGGLVMVNFYSKFLSCSENSTVHDAVAHINHIKRVAGIDHVGLGAGYDGINYTPKGLEDVSSYPTLFAELLGGGWTIDELTKLAGGNFLRVMQQVEKIRDDQKIAGVKPFEDHPNFRTDDPYNCTSS